jgi:VanZ family protein
LTASLPDGVRVDLAAHFIGHIALVVALVAGANLPALVAFAVSVLLGFAFEALQSTPLAPGRMASFEDFVAGSAGAGLGASICTLAKAFFSGGGDQVGLEGPAIAAEGNQERTEFLDP